MFAVKVPVKMRSGRNCAVGSKLFSQFHMHVIYQRYTLH